MKVFRTVAGIIGTIQANEILKNLSIGQNLNGFMLILDFWMLILEK